MRVRYVSASDYGSPALNSIPFCQGNTISRCPPDIRRDHELTLSHCLQRLQRRHKFRDPLGHTGIDEDIHEPIESLNVRVGHAASKYDCLTNSEVICDLPQSRRVRAVTDEQNPDRMLARQYCRYGPKQDIQPFKDKERPYEADSPARRQPKPRCLCGVGSRRLLEFFDRDSRNWGRR